MSKAQTALDLINLFQAVTSTLDSNRQNLNQADTYNHDHGDNMVQAFQLITQALKQKKGAAPAAQLSHASKVLGQQKSGSAQLYAQGLAKAAEKFKGQTQVTPDNAMMLVQALLGAEQPPAQAQQGDAGDLLSALLGGAGQSQPSAQQGGAGDLLGALLGAATQTQAPAAQGQGSDGIGVDDLLNAGMAFLNTKARGGSNLEAAINALVQSSAVGSSSPHRSQSGALVVNALLQAIGAMARK
ncbi:MAG: DAK2 domain-containing protein [Anaerolineales bacterium]